MTWGGREGLSPPSNVTPEFEHWFAQIVAEFKKVSVSVGDHTHPFTEIIGSIADAQVPASAVTQHQAALAIAWGQLTGVPSTFTPSVHTHGLADLLGFGAAGGYLRSTGTAWARVSEVAWGDLSGVPTTLSGTVNLTGDQTVGGIKSFTASPTAPSFHSQNPLNTSADVSLSWVTDTPRLRVAGVGAGANAEFQVQGTGDFLRAGFASNGDFRFIGTLTGGTVPWARLTNVPTLPRTGTFHMEDYGALGGSFTATLNAAIAAASAAGGGMVLMPPGSHSITSTVVIPRGVHIAGTVGAGAMTILNVTTAVTGIAFDARETAGDVSDNYTRARHFSNFYMYALPTAGAGTIAIAISNQYRIVIENVWIAGFTGANGKGILIQNATTTGGVREYTEGTLIKHCYFQNNKRSIDFNVVSGADASFAETKIEGIGIVVHNNQTGIYIGAGVDYYGGHLDVKINFENTAGTPAYGIEVATDGKLVETRSCVLTEGNVLGAKIWKVHGGAKVRLRGYGDSRYAEEAWAYPPSNEIAVPGEIDTSFDHYGILKVNADGDVTILSEPTHLSGLLTLRFRASSRDHRIVCLIDAVQFDDRPRVTVLQDFPFSGHRCLSIPWVSRRSSDDTWPHVRVNVSNRNAGTDLIVRWHPFHMENDLHFLRDSAQTLEADTRGGATTSVGKLQPFAAGDTTPSVRGGTFFRTANTSATTITAFLQGYEGQEIFIKFNDANTTVDFTATTLKGNNGVDWPAVVNDSMRCVYDGTNWLCDVSNAS